MPRTSNRTARLEARVSPEVLAIVKTAADLQGRSVSDFVVAAAQDLAQRIIEETTLVRLALDDQRRFVDLLLDPPEPAPALRRAAQAHAALVERA